jgi:tetratricopeptide (TPR) repeat protein
MSRTPSEAIEPACPEELLLKASRAKTPAVRARYAQRALKLKGPIEPTTRAMLFRQLYLVAMERQKFGEAEELAQAMLALDVLVDIAHQDAARACLGLKNLDGALGHLRLAARRGPASRRAFHLSMLGALLYLNGRGQNALPTLELAARWSTTDKPICRAQLALAKHELGIAADEDFEGLRRDLEQSLHHRGYDEYLLGELCALLGDDDSAQRYFESFVERTTSGRVALFIALQAEIGRARRYLDARARADHG